MQVQEFSVGPILGEVTPERARIFGRIRHRDDEGLPRRCHGVLRIREAGKRAFRRPIYCKMNPNFDMTGVLVPEGLATDTRYQYQVGWFASDVDTDDVDVRRVLRWDDVPVHEFTTASGDPNAARSLAVGSCRYLLRLFGGNWFDDRGDKTFRSIFRRLEDGSSLHALLMMGDQIYADDLRYIGADIEPDEFNRRYREVFSQPYIRKLMHQVPTYMTLDDHEIEDNWPADAKRADHNTKFPAAIHAYQTYQMSHSPLIPAVGGRLQGRPERFWYRFQDGCCDFFVTDTRTERRYDVEPREIVSPEQLDELVSWLSDGSNRVKVLVTSVPLYESTEHDKWNGFIQQRDRILQTVRHHRPRMLVLSGDVHASMASELRVGEPERAKLVSVVSSAFYWPYPHPRRSDFLLDGDIETALGTSVRAENASRVVRTDNFTWLDVNPNKVVVTIYSRKGDKLEQTFHQF